MVSDEALRRFSVFITKVVKIHRSTCILSIYWLLESNVCKLLYCQDCFSKPLYKNEDVLWNNLLLEVWCCLQCQCLTPFFDCAKRRHWVWKMNHRLINVYRPPFHDQINIENGLLEGGKNPRSLRKNKKSQLVARGRLGSSACTLYWHSFFLILLIFSVGIITVLCFMCYLCEDRR